jgi:glutamyl-tRNA(Gln) amidotransferase subunit D
MKKPFKNPEPGDRVQVILDNKSEEGILLDTHDREVLLLKLDSGYNIGIKKEDVSEIKVIKEKEAKKEDKKEMKLSGQKPIIDFYLTGGTISSKLDPETGGVKDLTKPEEFFSAYPEILEIADIRIYSPFTKWSENMDSENWMKLAKEIGKSLNNPEVKGVIVSHGTDFLHYTGAALSFMLGRLNKPVVLTYSQRSSDRGSSDARLNLVCAAKAALSDIAEVMLVGHASTNDDYCYALQANKCRKMHTSRRDAFRPINCKPFAKVYPDKIEMIRADANKRSKEKVKVDAVFEDKIALVMFYPGQSPEIIDYYRGKGYKGIVVEMSGLGHVITSGKNNWIPKLTEAIKAGMFVMAVPQTIYGMLHPYVYESARRILDTGVVYLKDILPETGFVKFGWVLGHKDWTGSVVTAKKMQENVAGEFNEGLGVEFME